MGDKTQYINRAILTFGLLVSLIQITRFINSSNTVNHIFAEIENEMIKTQKMTNNCNAINLINSNNKIEILDLMESKNYSSYSKLMDMKRQLNNQLSALLMHSNNFDKLEVTQDFNSNKILVGSTKYLNSSCESYEIAVNSKFLQYDISNTYQIKSSDSLRIKIVHKYFNHLEEKIEETEYRRLIILN